MRLNLYVATCSLLTFMGTASAISRMDDAVEILAQSYEDENAHYLSQTYGTEVKNLLSPPAIQSAGTLTKKAGSPPKIENSCEKATKEANINIDAEAAKQKAINNAKCAAAMAAGTGSGVDGTNGGANGGPNGGTNGGANGNHGGCPCSKDEAANKPVVVPIPSKDPVKPDAADKLKAKELRDAAKRKEAERK